MKKPKWYHYIGVTTRNGMKLVTKVNYSNNTTEWGEGKPQKFPISIAKDIVFGLTCNGFIAVVITTLDEFEKQI